MGTSYTSNLTSQAHCSPEFTKYNDLYIDSRFILDLSFQIQISMQKTIDNPNHIEDKLQGSSSIQETKYVSLSAQREGAKRPSRCVRQVIRMGALATKLKWEQSDQIKMGAKRPN